MRLLGVLNFLFTTFLYFYRLVKLSRIFSFYIFLYSSMFVRRTGRIENLARADCYKRLVNICIVQNVLRPTLALLSPELAKTTTNASTKKMYKKIFFYILKRGCIS